MNLLNASETRVTIPKTLSCLEVWFVIGVGALYAIYTVCWLWWHLAGRQGRGTIADTSSILFSGGSRANRNVLFVAIAAYRLLSTGLLNQLVRQDRLELLSSAFARLLAFLLCLLYWNHMMMADVTSLGDFLQRRYGSKIVNYAYITNHIIGLYYMWSSYTTYYEFHGLFSTKTIVSFYYLMLCLITFSAIGGMAVILVGCSALWLVELAGLFILFKNTQPYMFRSVNTGSFEMDSCYEKIGVNNFFQALSELLTIQPVFNLFQVAGNRAKANTAMGIAVFLYILNVIWHLCTDDGIRYYSQKHNIPPSGVVHHMFGKRLSRSGVFYPISDHGDTSVISFNHFIVLLGAYAIDMMILFNFHMQNIALHIYRYGLPSWMRRALINDGLDLHLVYSCIYLVTAYFFKISLLRSELGATPSSEYTIFLPRLSGMLITPVTVIVLLAPLVADLWFFPANVTIFLTGIVEIWFIYEDPKKLFLSCMAQWHSAVLFAACILCTIISVFVGAPRTYDANLLFKYHMNLYGKDSSEEEAEKIDDRLKLKISELPSRFTTSSSKSKRRHQGRK
ncbi:unnamed protein product [Calicophoron daubneyi]|uniref:Uncharacterized protein n=1 Tax=Calicophoron daubneyi TaxID=300641 RepID=A0AAV2TI83_CALDB